MGILLDRLKAKKLLVSDGAWGTMLQAKGLKGGDVPELWNATNPEAVKSVAAAYAAVGCDVVLTNTFGGSRTKLAKEGLAERTAELNEKGARLSLQGAPSEVIAASIGPTGEFLEPVGDMTAAQMEEVFAEQIAAILKGGVRALCVETQSAIDEAACAIRAAKKLDRNVDVICTMTFSATPDGYKTMMGVSCQLAAEALTEAGADIVGANCGNGIEQMITIASEFKKYTDRPILIHANAGMPQLVDGKTFYKQSPADMAKHVKAVVDAGASILGGCCGTTPEHIAAIKTAIDPLRK